MSLHLASGNPHKVQELQTLSDTSGLSVEIVRAVAMPKVDEDTGTFGGNARKKAVALQSVLPAGEWVLADDSGVCVDALGGAPGVESAYYAGPQGDPAANLRKLAEEMRDVPAGRRGASFYCVLALRGPDGGEKIFEGRCPGVLCVEPAGGGGFGYDPLFVPDGFAQSYAQIGEAEKNRISHRARAWAQLAAWLRARGLV
ncbi:MAG: non-canonical purine NTP pyrophosphatase [Opitutae bacterium]|nr:non-canonical purine NTP pyrophosphatase [Opitutae bacterium]